MEVLLKLTQKEVNDVKRQILKSEKKVKRVPGEMTDMDIDMISLVHKGANKQKIQIYKEDKTEDENKDTEDEAQGLLDVLKSYFSGKSKKADTEEAAVKKVPKKTFASMMAVNDISENMWRANDTLRSVMRDIINNEDVADKKVALIQAVDEYSDYIKNKVNVSTIAKEDSFFDVPEVEIEKAGKKVSNKNLVALKEAQRALAIVISEAEPEGDSGEERNKEENEVKKEEMAEVMKLAMEDVLKPINDRLDEIEKVDGTEKDSGESESKDQEDIKDILKSVVNEALKPIESRLKQVEKSRGLAQSLEGDEKKTNVEKSDDTFDGYFV